MYDQYGNCNFKEAVDGLTTKRWIQYYEAEEQRLLQDIGSMISGEMMATRGSRWSSAKDTLWSSSSPFSTGSMQPNDEEKNTTGSTLLSSMCHLVNLVVHLRRQNKHLRKQVVCLDEMCKMQCLQSELLETARACVHASQSRYFLNSLDDDSGGGGGEEASSNCSQVEGGDATTQLFSIQPNRWVEAVDSTSPSSSSSSSPPSPLPVARVAIGRDQEQNKSRLDEENNHPLLEERLRSMEPAVVRKDSDEPVFSEVQLPNYSSTTSKKGTIQLNAVRHSYLSSASSAHCYTPVSLPDTSTSGRVSRILERLGIRKGLLKRPALSTSLATVDSAETKRHTVGPVRHVRLLSARKAFLKKRKRKISESDSWASSEAAAAGKIYSLLELPEKFDRNALAKIGANRVTASSMEKKQPALATDSEQYDDAAKAEKKIDDNADGLRQTFGSSASESQLNPAADKRSSVLSVHSDCRDAQRLRPVAGAATRGQSMSPSQMTVSNDSVFTSHEADQDGAYFSGVNVLKQLLALQEKNCILICQLRDKTKEYESIVDRVASLEESMRLLRNRLKFNSFLDTVHRKSTEKCFMPAAAAKSIEQQFKVLDQSIKEIKASCYRVQQTVLEAENKQHLINQRYLEKIENLQAANRDLARPLASPAFPDQWEHRHGIEQSERKYQTLYKFTVKLMQRVHRMRKALVETDCAYCNCSTELLQTQSSLLLAHAQIERQKAELNFCKASLSSGKTRLQLRRVQSYYGQDLLARTIDPELSFYLPFKVYGRQLAKTESESDVSLRIPDDTLEAEFLALINPSQRKAVPPKMQSYSKVLSQQVVSRRSNESRAKQLHRSEGKMLNRQATKKDHRSPSLQRLTKIGHVKQLAATFDSNRLDTKYDSTSVLPHYSYGLYYGQHQAVKQSSHQRAPVMEKHYDSISTMDRSDAATSSEQFDSSLTDSYRETEYETMIYQMSIRPVPLNVVPMTQQSHHQTITQPSPSMLPRIAGPPMPRSYVVSARNVRPLFCSVRPSSIPQRAATAVIRNRLPYENASAGQQVSRSSWLQKLRRKM